jgi:hypothetical protein
MTNTETDLKPCQCGAGMLVDNSKPDLDPDWEALQAGVKFCASRDGDVCWIKCTKCYASTRPCNTEEQATKEWNDGKLLPPIASRFFSKPAENAFMSEEIPKRSKPFTNPATPDHGLDKARNDALIDLDYIQNWSGSYGVTTDRFNNIRKALSSPVVGNAVNIDIDPNQFAVLLTHLREGKKAASWMIDTLDYCFSRIVESHEAYTEKDGNADGVDLRALKELVKGDCSLVNNTEKAVAYEVMDYLYERGFIHNQTPPATGWQIPDGWQIVPTEPTQEQMAAGMNADLNAGNAVDVYQAMIGAAPKPDETSNG